MQEQNSFALSYATPLRHFSQPSPHNRPSSTCCKWRSAWCDHHRRPESLLESEPDAWVAPQVVGFKSPSACDATSERGRGQLREAHHPTAPLARLLMQVPK